MLTIEGFFLCFLFCFGNSNREHIYWKIRVVLFENAGGWKILKCKNTNTASYQPKIFETQHYRIFQTFSQNLKNNSFCVIFFTKVILLWEKTKQR